MLRVAQLLLYPVKSCAAIAVDAFELQRTGPRDDRRWMWVDERGTFISQRSFPSLALVQPEARDGALRLSAPEVASIEITTGAGSQRTVEVWGQPCGGVDLGDAAAAWLMSAIGVRARLVEQRGPRVIEEPQGLGHSVSFADGYPLLVCGEASITAAARASGLPIDALRFRPNIVVSGGDPFDEDRWAELQVGQARILLTKPCSRCGVLDVDPQRGVSRPGLLKSLAQHRRFGREVRFGMNGLIERVGTVAVGDAVAIVRSAT